MSGSRINILPTNSWVSSKSVNEKIEYNFHSNSGDYASTSLSPDLKEWQSIIVVNGYEDTVKYSKTSNRLQVNHGDVMSEYTGRISSDGKRIEFFR